MKPPRTTMNTILPFILLLIVLGLTTLITWGVTEINRLQTNDRKNKSKAESTRRIFSQFVHKLATEAELADAMHIVASQIQEDLDAESVGIFIPKSMTDSGTLHGASCTGFFPILTETDSHGSINAKLFENARYRMAYFRNEIVRPGEGILGSVVKTRQPVLLNMESLQLIEFTLPDDINTMMILPLMAEERFVGLLVAVNRNHTIKPFSEAEFELFKDLSSMVSLTSSLILIYDERDRQDRIRRELEFSGELQKSLLPVIPEKFQDYETAAFNKSCHEVSGDFYDYVELSDDRVLLMVADATGKGVPACLLTSMCRSFMRSLAEHYTDLNKFLYDLNRLMFDNSDEAHSVTANILVLNKTTGRCEFGCAGHTPMLVSYADGTYRELKPSGTALGMWPADFVDFETVTFNLLPGMRLCFFTDGFNEALNENGEEFGMERLGEAWKRLHGSPKDTINELIQCVDTFTGDEPQSDDQTIMVITRKQNAAHSELTL